MGMPYRLTKLTCWLSIYCLSTHLYFRKISTTKPVKLFWEAAYHYRIGLFGFACSHGRFCVLASQSSQSSPRLDCTEHYIDLYNPSGTTVNAASGWSNIETITHEQLVVLGAQRGSCQIIYSSSSSGCSKHLTKHYAKTKIKRGREKRGYIFRC